MTNSFDEFEKSKMFLVIGSNMTEAHPVASTFVKNAVKKGAQLIVIDPRAHKLVDFAQTHVPLKVGSDIALLNGIMHVLIEEDLYDKDFVKNHCTNFEALQEKVMQYPPERAAEISGIKAEDIRQLARTLASVKPVTICYTLGITEHTCGKNNVMSVANLQMLLGGMGMECGGVNPLRGQNNVQGACDMGALPNVFPGYQKVTDPKAVEKFEKAWNTNGMSNKNGKMIPTAMEGLVTKETRIFYVFGENMVNTEPDIRKVEHEFNCAEFVIVNDLFMTETAQLADVVLPAAAWSEKDGTFTNSERRISRVRAVASPPGQAKPDWWIFKQIAKRFGHNWESDSAQELWDNEIAPLSPPFAGVTYDRIEQDGLQWPCPSRAHNGTAILHKNGQFSHGKGIFMPSDWTPPAEVADEEYPFVLSTGRRLYHYHTRTQTGNSEGLNDLLGEETVDMSPDDANRLQIVHGEVVRVSSRRGKVEVKAKVTQEVPKGMAWMAFHFREGNANWLTNPAFDPETETAEYKACAVKIEKIK